MDWRTSGANVVAIDEPEMHLHPTAQKLVARILTRASAQAVLATHSSHIASELPPAELGVVKPGLGVSQLTSSSPAAEFFFAARWWQDEFVQPLTARCLAAVEGPSERMLVGAVADALKLNLHRGGVHVFDLGGADQFKNAFKAFGPTGFGIRMVGLVDEDHRAQWAKVIGVAAGDLEQEGYNVCDPDLEGVVATSLGADRVVELLDASGLFREQSLLAHLGAKQRSDVSDVDMADYLRGHKAESAAALARTISSNDAAKLAPIVATLNESLK
jgi:putative ATP-dependent endonuclease of the OLD family